MLYFYACKMSLKYDQLQTNSTTDLRHTNLSERIAKYY